MHDDGTALWSATRLADAIRTKDLASRELLELYLARIERLNPLVNAVVTLDADRARAAARAADEALTRGETAGPLHGLPVTVKDAIEVVGVRSTGGAVELRDHVPAADAPAVARLKAAGAIVFGKTNCPR
nr:amidase family protein [Acidimicrobiales bacterium]